MFFFLPSKGPNPQHILKIVTPLTCWHGPDPQCNFHLHRARPQKRCCLLLLLICWRAWSSMQFRSSWGELCNCSSSWNEKHLKYYKAKYFPQVSFCKYHIRKKGALRFTNLDFFNLTDFDAIHVCKCILEAVKLKVLVIGVIGPTFFAWAKGSFVTQLLTSCFVFVFVSLLKPIEMGHNENEQWEWGKREREREWD